MFLDIEGLKVFYKRMGSGPPLLLLHGWGGNADSFFPVFNFMRHHFDVYALDLPGFGRSSFPPEAWGVEEYADFVHRFMRSLGLERVYIIAHSFGGRIAIVLSATRPESVGKLVLVNSAGLIPKRGLRYHLRVWAFKALKKLFIFMGKDVSALYRSFGSKDYREAEELRPIFVKVVNRDLRSYLSYIRCPTLLIWGDRDQETPLYFGEVMEKEIPQAKLVILRGAGHFSFLERMVEFNEIVLDFLRGG